MVSLLETTALIGVSAIPALSAGLFMGYRTRKGLGPQGQHILDTVAAGVIVWFFLDVMSESAFLGVNQGPSGSPSQILLAGLFPLGLVAMVYLDKQSDFRWRLDPSYLAAVAIGLHAMSEGVVIGSGLAPASGVLAAFGGIRPAESFVTHKILEGFALSMFLASPNASRKALVSVLVAGLPTVLGGAVGLTFSPNSSFFFALSGGAALWLLSQLLQKSLSASNRVLWAISLSTGLLLMYSAALLHS